jgi:chemotaxis protein MotD
VAAQGANAAVSGSGDAVQPTDPGAAQKLGAAAPGPGGTQSAPATQLTPAGGSTIVPLAQPSGNNPTGGAAEAPSGQATPDAQTPSPQQPGASAAVASGAKEPNTAATAPHQHDLHDGDGALGPQNGPSDIRAADTPPTAAAGQNGMSADPTQSPGVASSANLQASTNPAATAAASAPPANSPAPVPVSGLAVAIAARAHDGTNRFEIRLDPPELGRIDVRLHVDRDGTVTSHLFVDRSDTLNLLRRDAPSLERALQTAGLKTGEQALQFSLRDQPREQATPNAPAATRVIIPDEVQPLAAATSVYAQRLGIGAGIDIRV